MLRRIICLFCFIIFAGIVSAQTTHISGRVYSSDANEPMPFVSIIALGTTYGGVSDIDGNFNIPIIGHVDSIRAIYVGFFNTTLKVKQGQTQVINIPMKAKSSDLEPVTILPGENPAITLLKLVYKHKPENDKEKLDAYQYEVYNKLEFDLNNIDEKFQKSKVMKPVKFIFDNIDTTNPSEKPHLPLFFSESISDFYYQKNPKIQKEIIKGSKVSGLEDASVAQFTGDMYQNVNVYDNNILVFGKTFVSPISNNGPAYYKYYLVDSLVIDGHWCYQIQFKPRRKQELLFYGNVWIADTAYAVKRLEMNIVDDANINYVNSFNVIQEYDNTSGAWLMIRERVIGDFVLADKKMGFYGRKTASYRDIVINKPQEPDFYKRTDNLVVEKGAESRNDSFWVAMRHDSLSKTEKGIYQMVDSVQSLHIYKAWETVVITAYTGYKVMGPFEFGPWYKTISGNPIEGTRFRLGGRTSNSFSRWMEFSGYVAYGLKDEQFKYNFAYKTFITKKPRRLTGINYKDDNEILGLSNNAFSSDNVLATIFRRSPFNNYTHVESYEYYYEREWFKGLDSKLSFTTRNMYPVGTASYSRNDQNGNPENVLRITTSEIKLGIRFAYNDKYVESTFTRASVGTKAPIIQLLYVEGLKGVFGSQYQYRKVSINLDDRLRFGIFGYTNYILEAGKTWGTVPFPLMTLHPGNETYVYDWSAYNMMNYFEFASDMYATATIIHHFDGFFLNHIPLMRKLKWREVATFKWLVGSVEQKNKQEILFPSTLYTLNHGPYMEAGAGIENIFKFFRVDCFWRLTYLDHPNVAPVGVRVSLQVLF
ncbi:DUF5686 and carboxypeptidase-like regulatory domain-containing protein [soil metagenome]